MSYTLVNFINYLTLTYLMGNFYANIITNKYRKSLSIFVYLIISLMNAYCIIPIFERYDITATMLVIKFIVALCVHLAFPFFMSTDNYKKNIINCIIFIFTLIFFEMSLGILYYLINNSIARNIIMDNNRLIWGIIGNAYYFLLSTVLIFIIQVKRKQIEDTSMMLTVLMPFIQVILMISLFLIYFEIVSKKIIFFGEIALTTFILGDYIAYKIIERNLNNYELRKKLEFTELKYQYDYSYYELATDKFKEISKIRHDINNQLQSIYALISYDEEENKKVVLEMLDQLQFNIYSIKNIKYCENQIVNTILVLKGQIAEKKHIKTTLEIANLRDLRIKDIDLCSIFSNLYDNAIEACDKIESLNKFIKIKTDKKSGYIIIKFTNSSYENLVYDENNHIKTCKNDKLSHGYGLKIVKSIVENYDGEIKIKKDNDIFEVCIMIPQ